MKNRFLIPLALIIINFIINPLFAQDLTHFSQNRSSVHGSISATAIGYGVNGIAPRKDPFSYVLAGNVNVNLKGFVLPFSFVYSNKNKDFRQPFNQFGLSPRYKWITVHLGYRNISFSKYVLGGHTVFGAGVELNPGLFRFGFVYGRLQRKTNTAIKLTNPLTDTLTSFSRKMYSVKIGVGNRKTFFDLIFLKAADDSTTLDSTAINRDKYPSANVVGGINTHIAFSKTLHFEAEAAYSVYTVNQNSDAIPIEVPNFNLIPINISTQFYLAVRGSLIYKSRKGLMLGLNYRRIDPEYKSMGIYYLNNDFENITFSMGFRLFKNKFRFNGSAGTERNNLKLSRKATTKKFIGSANISYDPAPVFGINVNYSNYSLNQQAGRVQISDSVKIYQTNSTFTVMPHFQFRDKKGKTSHFINLMFTDMGLKDKNPVTNNAMDFTTTNIILSYNLGFLHSGLNFIVSANYNIVNTANGKSTNRGITGGISKTLLKNKMRLALNVNGTQSTNNTESFTVITPSFNASYRVGKHHNFRLRLYAISNKNKTDNSKTFNEQTGDFSYVFTF